MILTIETLLIHLMQDLLISSPLLFTITINGFLVAVLVYLCGVLGIAFNRRNILLTMLCIEMSYLGAIALILIGANNFDAVSGQIYALMLLILAAAESAVGLGVLITVYFYENTIDFNVFNGLRG